MVKPTPTQPSRSASSTRAVDRLILDAVGQAVGAVDFENGRHLAGEAVGALLEQAKRRGVAAEPGVDRQLIEIVRIVGRRVRGEAARRAMLVALVHRQDHHLAGAGEAAVRQQPDEIGLHAGRLALVPGQDLFDLGCELHRSTPFLDQRSAGRVESCRIGRLPGQRRRRRAGKRWLSLPGPGSAGCARDRPWAGADAARRSAPAPRSARHRSHRRA